MDRRDDRRMVKVTFSKSGAPLRSSKPKKPAGMSGRQWKKLRKAKRREFNNRTGEFASIP